MEQFKRIFYIDLLKGFAILCVIVGHISVFNPFCKILTDFVYSFHMALFFFLSGYLYSISSKKSIKEVVLKKTKTLIMPYFAISFLACMIHGFTKDALIGYFISETRWGYWFLPTLFIMFVFIIWLRNMIKRTYILIMMIVVVELGFILLKYTLPTYLVEFCLMRHLATYWLFFVLGIVGDKIKKIKSLTLISFLAWLWIIILAYNNILNNEIMRMVGRLSAIYFMFFTLKEFNNNKLQKYRLLIAFGKSSIVIYMFHYFMLPIVQQYIASVESWWKVNFLTILLSLGIGSVCIILDRYIITENKVLSKFFLGE